MGKIFKVLFKMAYIKPSEIVRIGTYKDDESAIYFPKENLPNTSLYYEDFKKVKRIIIDNQNDLGIIKRILKYRDEGYSESKIISMLCKAFSREKVKDIIKKMKQENIFTIAPSDEIYINIEKTPLNISFISFSFTKPLAIIMDKEKNIHAQINTNPFYIPTTIPYPYSDLVGATLYVYLYTKISKFLNDICVVEVDYLTECDIKNSIKQLEEMGAENIKIIKNKNGCAIKFKIKKKIILSFMGFREISPNEFSCIIDHNGERPAWLIRNEISGEADDYLIQDALFYSMNHKNKIKIDVAILNNGVRDIAEGSYFATQKTSIQRYIIKGIIEQAKELKIKKCTLRYFTYNNFGLKEEKREAIQL